MTTVPVQERIGMSRTGQSFGHEVHETKDYLTREEFMDKLAKELGSIYGLSDIREAQ